MLTLRISEEYTRHIGLLFCGVYCILKCPVLAAINNYLDDYLVSLALIPFEKATTIGYGTGGTTQLVYVVKCSLEISLVSIPLQSVIRNFETLPRGLATDSAVNETPSNCLHTYYTPWTLSSI